MKLKNIIKVQRTTAMSGVECFAEKLIYICNVNFAI